MITSGVRLLTDENVHPQVATFLRNQGCDVFDVKEERQAGAAAEALLRRAETEGRIVVTHDRDFGQLLVARGELHVGILYLRPGHIDPAFTIETLRVLSEYDRPDPPFIVVAERQERRVRVRVRTLGGGPGVE